MLRSVFLVLLLALSPVLAQELPSEINDRDKPYGGHPRQLMDITARPLTTLKPALLFVHGGSWQSGDKRAAVAKTEFFLQQGFAVAAMNYRFHPEVTPREQAQDVAAAAVWLANNANLYGIDPRQIYLVGHASGAHLVSLVGTDPFYLNRYDAQPVDLGGVIALDAEVYDVPTEVAETTIDDPAGRILRQVFTDNTAFWPIVSPAYQTAKAADLPPFFIAHSSATTNDFRQAKPFAAQLRQSGAVAVLFQALSRNRESIFRNFGMENDPTTESVIAFIRREANILVSREEQTVSIPDVPWFFSFQAGEEDRNERMMTGTEITDLTSHEGLLFAGNAHTNSVRDNKRGQVLRLDGRDSRWQLDFQMPLGYSRIASMESVSFSVDADGLPIEDLNYLVVGASQIGERGRDATAAVFIRTPSSNWTKFKLGTIPDGRNGAHVEAIAGWRDQQSGRDHILAAAGPAPLGIYRGAYSPEAIGGLRFEDEPEYVPRGNEQVRSFATCGGRLYAATDRQILRRVDGAEPRWEPMLDMEDVVAERPLLENIDIYWQRNYQISSFRCDRSSAGVRLAFTTLNRAFNFTPGDRYPLMEVDLANMVRTDLGREPHYVQAMESTIIRRRGRDLEEWIGLEIYYDPNYLIAQPDFPFWPTGFGKDAWYLVRSVVGGQVHYRIEQIFIPGNDPHRRPLARVMEFERSPFEKDHAIYVGGFAPWFEAVADTAWIARGEL